MRDDLETVEAFGARSSPLQTRGEEAEGQNPVCYEMTSLAIEDSACAAEDAEELTNDPWFAS